MPTRLYLHPDPFSDDAINCFEFKPTPEVKELSDWICIEGYAAMRIYKDSDPDFAVNRVAFIEKTPRVRVAPFVSWEQEQGSWKEGPKGSLGSDVYSRQWCDQQLREMGFIVPEDNWDVSGLDLGRN